MAKNKKNMIVVINGYYPHVSAIASCAEKYLKLLKSDYSIDVICPNWTGNSDYEIMYNGQKIHYLGNWRFGLICKLEKKLKTRRLIIWDVKLKLFVLKGLGWLINKLKFCGYFNWFFKKAVNAVKKINEKKKVDVIFTFSGHYSAHAVGKRIKGILPRIRWVTYTSDSLSAYYIGEKKFDKLLKIEQEILCVADYNLATNELIKSKIYALCENKVKLLPYLLQDFDTFNSKIANDIVNDYAYGVYAGRFYVGLREPLYVLQVFSKIEGVKLNIYSEGSFQKEIDDFVSCSKGKIKRYNLISQEKLYKEYFRANFLLSIGNNNSNFQPSKIYEYVSTGKPVIHFYYDGMRDQILDKYPLSLQIKINDDMDCSVISIKNFLNSNANKQLDRDEIERIFCESTSGFVTNVLCSVL